jgi:hypothetical protein
MRFGGDFAGHSQVGFHRSLRLRVTRCQLRTRPLLGLGVTFGRSGPCPTVHLQFVRFLLGPW